MPTPAQPGSPGPSTKLRLCRFDELPDDGTGRSFPMGSLHVAAFRQGDQVHVIADTCPHAGASLGMGILSRGEVTCPAHALHFSLTTGCSSDGEGERVRVWPAEVDPDGWVQVENNPRGI